MIKQTLNNFINIISALFFRELKTRFGKNKMGYAWVILEPMAHIMVMLLIFGFVRNKMLPQIPFEIFLTVGMVSFFLIRNIVMKLLDSIDANKSLFYYRPLKPIHVFITRTFLETIIYITIMVIILFSMYWIFEFNVIPNEPLYFILTLFFGVIFAFSLGLPLLIFRYYFPNSKLFITVIFQIFYFTGGILYPLWIIPKEYMYLILINPVVHIIELLKNSFFKGYPLVEGINYYYPTTFLLLSLLVGLFFYYHKRERLGSVI